MRALPVWADKVHDREGVKQTIYAICFKPDGTQLIAGAGHRVLVYEAADGELLVSLKGHKDTVYCVAFARDGKRFASGGADKTVIIWTDALEGVLKYSHNDAIQSLAFNPVTGQLASCTVSDVGFWSVEAGSVNKFKVPARVCSASWTNDGQYIALGMFNGNISIRNRNGDEKVAINRPSGAPIWSLAWNPSKAGSTDVLAVCDWNQTLSFYMLSGRQIGRDQVLDFDPCTASYFTEGEFMVIGGSDKKASLYTREGVRLHTICEQEGWVWSTAVRPKQNYVAVGCQDGTIALYQLIFSTVHGLYKERYAYRRDMTDVVIQDLASRHEARIKCRDLVKKIAIYKSRLAVQLPNQLNVYDLSPGDEPGETKFRLVQKLKRKIECNLLVVCAKNIILCQEKRLQCLSMDGQKEREWVMDSMIRYIKVSGGPPGREGLLVGLKNGQILKIFVDNAFPMELIKQQTAVRCLDLSASRNKLAVVDENNTCLVYDLTSRQLLFQEPNANSVSWNTENEDMLCFTGNGILHIKAANFPIHQQKLQGFVVGFQGSQIYCLHVFSMTAVDVPQSSSMSQYLNEKEFEGAYKIACLGVTEADWRALALDALEGLNLNIAKNCFVRIRDLRYLELIHTLLEKKKRNEYESDSTYLADIYAFQGKFAQAAELYVKSGRDQQAMEMYTDLRMFDKAKEYMRQGDSAGARQLMQKQQQWSSNAKDPTLLIDLLLHAGEELNAVDIMGQNAMHLRLIEKARDTNKAETELLGRIAFWLAKLDHVNLAAEVCNKIGDNKQLVDIYVHCKKWDEAFSLAERYPDYNAIIYRPYAAWLIENDRFEDAQEAFRKANMPLEAIRVLQVLTRNAVSERRFNEAAYYFWHLSIGVLTELRQQSETGSITAATRHKFDAYQTAASLYHAYHFVNLFVEEPFTSHTEDALLNMARFLLLHMSTDPVDGISRAVVLYTLATKARSLGAFKTARFAYQQLQKLRLPDTIREHVELGTLTIQTKSFADDQSLTPICYRCSAPNPLICEGNFAGKSASNGMLACVQCKQPFVFSFYSFELLPVVEFEIDSAISEVEAIRLIQNDTTVSSKGGGAMRGGAEVLSLGTDKAAEDEDTFIVALTEFDGQHHQPVIADRAMLRAMPSSEVIMQRWPAPLKTRFFRNVTPDIPVVHCKSCNHMFDGDNYEAAVLKTGVCPFCRAAVTINGDLIAATSGNVAVSGVVAGASSA